MKIETEIGPYKGPHEMPLGNEGQQYVSEQPEPMPGADQQTQLAVWFCFNGGVPVGEDPE